MRAVDLAVVLLRIYAITLLVWTVDYVAGGTINLFWDAAEVDGFDLRAHGIAGIASGLLRAGFAVYLLARTGSVARLVCRGMPETESRPAVSSAELAILGFGVLGLWLLVEGLHGIVYSYADWRSNLRIDPMSRFPFDSRSFLASVVRVAAGLGLFLGARGVVRIAGWVRRAGAPEPIPPIPPA